MRLSEFIEHNLEPILDEWSDFARTIPAGGQLSVEDLRDHAALILLRIAREMRPVQSEAQQRDKSHGLEQRTSAACTPAELHGTDRHKVGFEMVHMVSEFRALRSTVIRQWLSAAAPQDVLAPAQVDELIRFNEGMDKALAESTARFMRDLDDARQLLLGVIAHDLRNPVDAMVRSGMYLQVSGGLSTDQARCADVVVRSGRRLARLITNLLEFTSLRLRGGLQLARRPADLATVCEDVLQEARAIHASGVYALHAQGDTRGHWDAGRLEQVVANLVENAFKHGEPGRPIALRLRDAGDAVALEVRNDGVIPPERLTTLFDPLVSWAAESSQGGTSFGLGLHIVREIVAAHGGQVEVTSTAEEGTAFLVRLPRS